jgi:hypothetical protein
MSALLIHVIVGAGKKSAFVRFTPLATIFGVEPIDR